MTYVPTVGSDFRSWFSIDPSSLQHHASACDVIDTELEWPSTWDWRSRVSATHSEYPRRLPGRPVACNIQRRAGVASLSCDIDLSTDRAMLLMAISARQCLQATCPCNCLSRSQIAAQHSIRTWRSLLPASSTIDHLLSVQLQLKLLYMHGWQLHYSIHRYIVGK